MNRFTVRCRKILPLVVATMVATNGLPALAASLSGSVVENANMANVNLTTVGNIDWAIWGHSSGGTSTSLSPDVRRSGGTAISSLTEVNPDSQALRGLGQFSLAPSFDWSNGAPIASATAAKTGLQHNVVINQALANGFSFTVPANTVTSTLSVYAMVHAGTGRLTAHLSDTSAPDLIIDTTTVGGNVPELFTLNFAAASSGQTLTVTWVTVSNPIGSGSNAAIYAVALSNPQYTIGGTVSGLATGETVVLKNNGVDDTPVASNTTFAFPTSLLGGAAYAVTVGTAPAGKTCTITNGTGTVSSANVTNVAVACTAPVTSIPTLSEWGMIFLSSLIAMFGIAKVRRRN